MNEPFARGHTIFPDDHRDARITDDPCRHDLRVTHNIYEKCHLPGNGPLRRTCDIP